MEGTTLRPGDEIAPGLRAVRHLGGGLRYQVHLAHSDHLRALVVVKVLREGLGPDALAAMHGEAGLLDRLAHPMLLRGLGSDLDGPRPYLILELIEGPRLSTLIREHGVDLEQLLPLALNLTSVLHYLEREGVAHLDVKPSNVIMGAAPRLIDLSIARPAGELASLARPVGTAAYMAPEQRDPARFAELGPAADVWGLGATLLESIERQRPLDEHGHPIPFSRNVPAPVRDAVLAALEPRPADRPTAGELGDALEPLVGALPAPRIGRFRPRRRTHRPNPKGDTTMTGRLMIIALAAVLALGGLGTAFALGGDDGGQEATQPIEMRKDDATSDEIVEEVDDGPEPGDGDATKGDDGTNGGDNTGDGDATKGDDNTAGGDNTGDGDATKGDDNTAGGDNTGDGDASLGGGTTG